MNMPYLEIKMTSGTICDLNGLPRMARVQYVCYPSGTICRNMSIDSYLQSYVVRNECLIYKYTLI